MRTALTLLVTTLLALLAGCTSPTSPEAQVEPAADVSPTGTVRNGGTGAGSAAGVTSGGGGTASGAPEASASAAADAQAHAHDLWGGAERITRLAAPISVDVSSSTGLPYAAFPALDGLVLEGTANVEVLLTDPRRRVCSGWYVDDTPLCTPETEDPAPSTTLRLEYRDASVTVWQDLGAIPWNEPIALPASPEQVDMPHSSASLWEFRVLSDDLADSTVAFDARIDIVRGPGEIPLWPGHPILYPDGVTEREVLRTSASSELAASEIVPLARPSSEGVPLDGLVSFGTRSLIVLVEVTKLDAPPGSEPSGWALSYRNASGGWNWTDVIPDGEPLRFVVPVDEHGMDSPYLESSRWQVRLRPALDIHVVPGVGVTGMTPPHRVEYDIVVVASSLAPAAHGGSEGGPR